MGWRPCANAALTTRKRLVSVDGAFPFRSERFAALLELHRNCCLRQSGRSLTAGGLSLELTRAYIEAGCCLTGPCHFCSQPWCLELRGVVVRTSPPSANITQIAASSWRAGVAFFGAGVWRRRRAPSWPLLRWLLAFVAGGARDCLGRQRPPLFGLSDSSGCPSR